MADEKFMGETEKESPPEKKLKLEVDDNKDDLKGEDDIGSDLRGEDGEYDPYDFMGEDDTGSDLKGEDGESIKYDPYDWQTYPDKDDFIKYINSYARAMVLSLMNTLGRACLLPSTPFWNLIFFLSLWIGSRVMLQWQSSSALAMMEKNAKLRIL
ncbi:uncharacterized protein LOC132610611 isoform X2 [Lycium barbarum]|uniref:uncharacterized protein LOC132610611 isoform X2 n=1 Tax=Lycium barbarum TaxID=112863 RepID=UPI00293EBB4A|nr:uncharacterized protein LOC132610611 isoform X2 [Lycium barbarum]